MYLLFQLIPVALQRVFGVTLDALIQHDRKTNPEQTVPLFFEQVNTTLINTAIITLVIHSLE